MSDHTASVTADNSNDMVKPNSTITKRHDKLLDKLADQRYATRSEALRVAIDELARSHSDNEEATVERLLSRIKEISNRLERVEKQLDALEDSRNRNDAPAPSNATNPVATAVSDGAGTTSDGNIGPVANEVHSELIAAGAPLTLAEITARIDAGSTQAHEAVTSLLEREYIRTIDRDESVVYEPKSPS